jgi:transcriptional regulator with XRE-family HTH domain
MEYRGIGENIRKYRNRLDLTQEELADRVGVTWEMVSRYERGESSPFKKLDKLANALNIPITDLIDDKLHSGYEVPLFNNIPKDTAFTKENTTIFYSCPKWLVHRDPAVFAIDTNIIDKSSDISLENGYIFISPNSEIDKADLVLICEKDKLKVEKFKYNGNSPIGKLLLQEVIFT